MTTFDDFISSSPCADPVLPLVHLTDGFSLRIILGEGELKPQDCPVIEGPALYFSYGRPAFRPNGGMQPTALSSYAPVCFVMDASKVPIKHVFPFDTGAFKKRMLAQAFHRKMPLKSFELAADLRRPQQVVAKFFGSNADYYDCSVNPSVAVPSLLFEAESVLSLFANKQTEEYDDRISAVEIISDRAVLLNGTVLAVVFPMQFLDNPGFRESLVALKCDPLPYPLGARFTSESAFGKISLIVRDYLVRMKALSK